MSKDRVINITPFHSEISIESGDKFTITFFDNVGGDYSRRKLVKVHFEGWWLRFLASQLWSVIDKRKLELKDDEDAMRKV